ncbi:MAG: sulfate ABC transporter substrate-binding protein [Oscillospiraceae bacterium]|nr:sulfate ABC transporter substrate-binding protein [Oscillospiraceae bacterium]
MKNTFRKTLALVLALLIALTLFAACAGDTSDDGAQTTATPTADIGGAENPPAPLPPIELTNVSYDPTRELYAAYNELFTAYWKAAANQDVTIVQSHGGSGSQARAVNEGLEADVVTLALEQDVNEVQNAGLIDAGWVAEFPLSSAPYTSTIVFLVRAGNPKNLQDWDDIVKPGVEIITPNPKTSGGARWNFLAAWAFEFARNGGDEAATTAFVKSLFGNVTVLDTGARGSTTTFVENGQGDVLLAWENEAFLALDEHPGEFEIVTPSVSILAQPSVAVVDANARAHGTETVAAAYLEYLYNEDAQRLAGDNYYRPSNQAILAEYADVFFLDLKLVNIDDDFGGWAAATAKFFADDAIFDQIYTQ